MSALARHYLHEGWVVSGSDIAESEITKKLVDEGAAVVYQQVAENITGNGQRPLPDLVVYTEAMSHDHPELVAAHALDIDTVNYFEALGRIANQYYLIAVAGAHGKTTTTAMLTDILEEAGFDPSVVVGSLRSKTGSNYRAGKSKYMLVEACEYKRDFLHLEPDVLIITNIDYEHVDYYHDLADVQSAFNELAMKVPADGAIICQVHDEKVVPAVEGVTAKVIDYRPAISLSLKLRQPGMHNRQNAAAAAVAAQFLNIHEEMITHALENFAGTWRRFEYKGEVHGAPVYDDYAHHPTEIAAAIAGVRELYPDKRLIVVFQAHTYSRAKTLRGDFVAALAAADKVIMLPIYGAREENDPTITAEMMVNDLVEKGADAIHFETIVAAAEEVKDEIGPNDIVLCVGAGSVTKVAQLLTE